MPAPRVLVINTGSSTLKYRVVEPASGQVLAGGVVERIGDHGASLRHRNGDDESTLDGPFDDHGAALDAVLAAFSEHGPDLDDVQLAGVGHRVVHGGERYTQPTLVDDEVVAGVKDLSVLAPLHNPAGVAGIEVARDRLPDLPHVAVFDTAFHAGIPAAAATYAVPREWRERHGVRRYGFHGTSYAYVSRVAAEHLGKPLQDSRFVVLHLGNGASACAVRGGRSVDTSMGLTPLAGLVMGTRSGDVDPAVGAHLHRVAGLGPEDVENALNKASGLKGLAGETDLREVVRRAQDGDGDAALALDVYCYRIRAYVGAYLAALGGADAVVFTAGVGENAALVRSRALEGLQAFGIGVQAARNADPASVMRPTPGGRAATISPDGSPVAVLVVPTDEEREIARQVVEVVGGA